MPVAYSYIRFSTSEQKKGDSLRRQTELSESYATKHGLTLDNSLHMHDLGLSAFDRSNIIRGALGEFLKAVERGRIAPGSFLLVESLDRLSRDKVLDALGIFISMMRQGITIVTLVDNMVYNTETVGSNFGNLIISITIMARAHEESATKSRRLLAAWENKRANMGSRKLTAQCPRWMCLNADKTEFDLLPDRVKLIMEIVGLVKAGMGQAQIAKRLNERAEPSLSAHGKGWHASYINKIITSTALYGEFQPQLWNGGKLTPHGNPIPDYYPALISKEEFFHLQNIRAQRLFAGARARKGTDIPNLLSGIVKCGYCGSTMILAGGAAQRVRSADGSEVKRPGKKVLVCDGARRGRGCFAVQWAYKDFEQSFLTFCRVLQLKQLLSDPSMIEGENTRKLTISEQLQSVNSAIEESTKRLERLMIALELGDTPKSILTRIRDLEQEVEILKGSREALVSELKTAEISSSHRLEEVESVRDLIVRLATFSGDKLFTVRATLAEHIRRLIEVVRVFPAGSLDTPEHIQYMRIELIKDGFSAEEVEAHIAASYRTAPERTGRGIRGRYASRKEIGRFFTIKAKRGGFRVVYPDFDDPTQVKIELGNNGA
ncbi:recombinase family protein [Massilia sp. PWRC2]|uniref:recombinase family protein n=1 Tax=Massilia sp. PWRC2 TaxID=2804626 RepID=UPI003CFB09E7